MQQKSAILRSLAFAAPALIAYIVVAPIACMHVDRALSVAGAIPRWLQMPGAMVLTLGAVIGVWTFVLFALIGHGTPNPIAPPRNLVRDGPFRYSRNPMMLGGWIAGFGLGLLVRSPAFLALCALFVVVGAVYVVVVEEPSLLRRFGSEYSEYCRSTPRWLPCPHRT